MRLEIKVKIDSAFGKKALKLVRTDVKLTYQNFSPGLGWGWGFAHTSVCPRKNRATSTTQGLFHRQTISRVKSDTYGDLMSGRDSLNKTEGKRIKEVTVLTT